MRESFKSMLRVLTYFLIGFIIIAPVLCFVTSGLIDREAIISGTIKLSDITLSHFFALFDHLPVFKFLKDTIVLSTFATLIATALSIPCSYFVARGKGKFPYQLYTLSLSIWLVPPIAFSLQIFFWYTRLNLYDNMTGLILLHGVINSTLAIVLIAPFMYSLPKSLDEAAIMDGLSDWNILIYVYIPAIAPVLLGVVILCFVRSWNELLFAVLLTDQNVMTLPIALLRMTTGSHIEWGQISALGFFDLLPILACILIFLLFYLFRVTKFVQRLTTRR